MVVTKIKENERVTLKLQGKLGATTSSQLQEILDEVYAESDEIILDLRDLFYISSSGLRALLISHKTAEIQGISVTLTNVPRSIKIIFDATGYSEYLVFG
ncbi:MAG: STAS domain-containing protein [Oscillospiraceae bacterium]|nr:STAS domain-containing protein [Oscillospiraceae bacterium]